MPEGDTIHHAARRIRPLLEGLEPEIAHPSPRLRGERWPQKLAGRSVEAVDAHRVIYSRAGRPCPRCGEPVRSRGQGDDNRITYWCAGCQR
ncbi:MAG: hypothetical protein ACR2LK_00900 [Solirubrobacteraceae bacterium]